jgi:hypothetical protein
MIPAPDIQHRAGRHQRSALCFSLPEPVSQPRFG